MIYYDVEKCQLRPAPNSAVSGKGEKRLIMMRESMNCERRLSGYSAIARKSLASLAKEPGSWGTFSIGWDKEVGVILGNLWKSLMRFSLLKPSRLIAT